MEIFLCAIILGTIFACLCVIKRSKSRRMITPIQQEKNKKPQIYKDGENYENAVMVVAKHMTKDVPFFEDIWHKIAEAERNFNKKTAKAAYRYITELEEAVFPE